MRSHGTKKKWGKSRRRKKKCFKQKIAVNLCFIHLPTTCIRICAVRVENDGASAVTSHEKLPDSPNPTFRRTTWLAFDIDNWKNKQMNKISVRELNYLPRKKTEWRSFLKKKKNKHSKRQNVNIQHNNNNSI